MDAAYEPAAAGEKVTVTSADPPALMLRDVGETEKAAASAPDRVIAVTERLMPPAFDTVRVCEPELPSITDPRARDEATEIAGCDAEVPVPLRETEVGLLGSL